MRQFNASASEHATNMVCLSHSGAWDATNIICLGQSWARDATNIVCLGQSGARDATNIVCLSHYNMVLAFDHWSRVLGLYFYFTNVKVVGAQPAGAQQLDGEALPSPYPLFASRSATGLGCIACTSRLWSAAHALVLGCLLESKKRVRIAPPQPPQEVGRGPRRSRTCASFCRRSPRPKNHPG